MQKTIELKQNYKSSTRIDARDTSRNSQNFINSFVAHDTAIKFINGVSKEFSGSSQRAFTVTGTYGTGKSTVALYLSYLLSENSEIRTHAFNKLEKEGKNPSLIHDSFNVVKGWKSIKHVCGIESPAQAILKTLASALHVEVEETSQFTDDQCLNKIVHIFNSIDLESDGILLLVDELGKAFEYQSRHKKDIHFFQELADIIQDANIQVIIVGFLHQSFAEYYNDESLKTRDSWKKVQGRYKDFGYNPSVDESLYLIGESLDVDKKLSNQLNENYHGSVELIAKYFSSSPESDIGKNKLSSKFKALQATLPIEPMVSILLGPIFKSSSFAQNERSLFGFLSSFERLGFRDFIEENYSNDNINLPLYDIDSLWCCLQENYQHLIETSSESKKWTEACDAVERAEDKGTKLHITITQLVALISVFGQKSGINAKADFIVKYFELLNIQSKDIESALEELIEWLILSPRKQKNSLVIFQGGDLDVQKLVGKRVKSLSNGVKWTQEYTAKKVYLATSHYHKFGAMRWANAHLIDNVKEINKEQIERTPSSNEPFLSFLLAKDEEVYSSLISLYKGSLAYKHVCIGLIESCDLLEEYAIELIALKKIEEEDEDLVHDPIAQQNIKKRKTLLEHKALTELENSFESAKWEYCGNIVANTSLQSIASDVADDVYNKSPIVLNELVNRTKPSGSANSAIRKLMMAMLNHGDKENLGFDSNSFPPEKGIYFSCLKSKGWHGKEDEGFVFPGEWSKESIKANEKMHALWRDGVDFIKTSNEMITLDALYNRWMKPPFGLTSGLCRLYGLALLKSLEGHVAFYDLDSTKQFIFIPELDEELVTKIYKHPTEAGVRYFEISEIQTHLLDTLAKATIGESKTDDAVLSIAKHIVKIVHTLPAWVKKTSGESFLKGKNANGLTKAARAFRNKVIAANDPYKLILDDLPNIFELKKNEIDLDEKLGHCLKTAIEDLSAQHDMLLSGFKQIILSGLSADFDNNLKARCKLIVEMAQRPNVKELASRLIKFIDGKGTFELVINLATGVPERNWTDKHLRSGLDELHNLCTQFLRIESFGKMDKNNVTQTLSFMTKDKNGNHKSFEGFTKFGLEDDADVKSAISTVKSSIAEMPREKQLATLTNLLSSLMEQSEAEVSNE